jgi:hypothetical protein
MIAVNASGEESLLQYTLRIPRRLDLADLFVYFQSQGLLAVAAGAYDVTLWRDLELYGVGPASS